MNLTLDIAWTHVRSRARQTGFAIAGVGTGVGFSIMMAALMQGSQDDFTQRLVNTLPHITVYDAAYVALAMLIDRPLLTADRRLARAASRLCQVELLAH